MCYFELESQAQNAREDRRWTSLPPALGLSVNAFPLVCRELSLIIGVARILSEGGSRGGAGPEGPGT